MNINIKVKVHPTEDEERVRKAIHNIFPDAEIDTTGSDLEASAYSLGEFARKITDQRIRDTARSVLRRSISDEKITFHLNKQAALAGKVNFTDGNSVLGDIEVRITTAEPEDLINHLTVTGKEVEE